MARGLFVVLFRTGLLAGTAGGRDIAGTEDLQLREQQGLSQIDLATDIGVNKNTIGAMERGESDFGISKLISVCEALQASPNDLLPDRLRRNDTLSSDMQKLQDRLSRLSPYQRTQCMAMINSVIDGVILSPNLTLESVETVDLGFECSDHNPVRLRVTLGE